MAIDSIEQNENDDEIYTWLQKYIQTIDKDFYWNHRYSMITLSENLDMDNVLNKLDTTQIYKFKRAVSKPKSTTQIKEDK